MPITLRELGPRYFQCDEYQLYALLIHDYGFDQVTRLMQKRGFTIPNLLMIYQELQERYPGGVLTRNIMALLEDNNWAEFELWRQDKAQKVTETQLPQLESTESIGALR